MMFVISSLSRRWTTTPSNKNVENIVKPLTFLQTFFAQWRILLSETGDSQSD